MTTPKKPASKAGGSADRVKRPTPGRSGPKRNAAGMSASGAPPDRTESAAGSSIPVSDAIADAVRRGYQVVGENIEQGRAAAEQFRTGHYSIRDVPYDLNQMALRLLILTRELSTTACDILEQVLRDPNLVGPGDRKPGGEDDRTARAGPPRGTGAPGFRPAPPPPRPDPSGGPPHIRLGAAAPPRAGAAPPDPPPARKPAAPPPVTLDVRLTGKPAVVRAATLAPPNPPSPIAAPGLIAADANAAAIRAITFSPGGDPLSMTVTIVVPDDQPAGVYSGVICAAETQIPLGTLAIEVTG